MGTSLEQDLARRDYSVNAIALPLAALCAPSVCDQPDDGRSTDALAQPAADGPADEENAAETRTPAEEDRGLGPINPGGGLADLRARRLRALGEANLLEDPLRLLRGVRLACELDFTIDAQTLTWIQTHHLRLAEVAGERVLAELERLAAAPDGAEGLLQLRRLGLLRGWQGAPEAQGEAPDGHTPAAETRWLERLTPDRARRCGLQPQEQAWALPLARLAALLPPPALVQLRASRRLQQRCHRLRHWMLRLENGEGPRSAHASPQDELTLVGLPEEERLALQRDLEDDLPALALHLEPLEAREALQRWRDGNDPLFHPRPPLDGLQLQQRLGIPPGRTLGALLAHLTRERAFDRLPASAGTEAVLQMARHWLAGCSNGEAGAPSGGQAP
jgi:tRNA nucleotidyltransferase (CCA-adding enzyme)